MNLAYLKSHSESVRLGLIDTISRFDETDLDFRPFANSRTIREVILHIANEERGERDHGIRQILTEFPPEYDPSRHPILESIQALLENVHTESRELLDGLT